MKRIVLITILSAAAAMTCFAGCGEKKDNGTASKASQDNSQTVSIEASVQSSTEAESAGQTSAVSEDIPIESEPQESRTEESETQESVIDDSKPEESDSDESEPEESEPEESEPEESDAEKSNTEESPGAAADGYYFDDEEIVEDYHTATVFTDDEDFNKLFAENEIDKSYNEDIKLPETVADMRIVTADYARRWQEQAEKAYSKLAGALEDKPAELEKLAVSQEQWTAELEEKEAGFQQEAAEQGTYGLLAADTAMMNYYKGRAAVLYHQLYLISGSFDMS